MNPHSRTSSSAFVNQLLVCLLVAISFGGSIGLGTVWMRHQISVTANNTKVIEARIAELSRHLADVTATIETEQTSIVLRQRNTELGLGLVPPTEAQIFRVTDDPIRLLAAKRNRDLYNDGATTTVKFRVAQADR